MFNEHQQCVVKTYENPEMDKEIKSLQQAVRIGEIDSLIEKIFCETGDEDYSGCRLNMCLLVACKEGKSEVVEFLLNNGADVNYSEEFVNNSQERCVYVKHPFLDCDMYYPQDDYLKKTEAVARKGILKSWSPLMFASYHGHLEIVRLLIEYEAEIEFEDTFNWTPLMLAVEMGHVEVVQYLIQKKANVNATNSEYMTPLFIACYHEDKSLIKMLFECNPLVDIQDRAGFTCLMIVAQRGILEWVKIFLNGKADLHRETRRKLTAIMFAVEKQHTQVVNYLLDHGADIRAVNDEGDSCLHLAALNGNCEIAQVLLKKGSSVKIVNYKDQTPFIVAASSGNIQMLRLLETSGSDIKATDKDGCNAMMLAAKGGHTDVVEFLLKAGLDVNTANNNGRTALNFASYCGHLEVVKLLLECGAHIDNIDKLRRNALIDACLNGHYIVVKFLLEKFPHIVNDKDIRDKTPLVEAVKSGNSEVVKLLLDSGANVNFCSLRRISAAVAAVTTERADLLQLLFDYGLQLKPHDEHSHLLLFLSVMDVDLSKPEEFLENNFRSCGFLSSRPLSQLYRDFLKARDAITDLEKSKQMEKLLDWGWSYLKQFSHDITANRNKLTEQVWSSRRRNPELLRILLDNGVQASNGGKFQINPLSVTVYLNSIEKSEMLLQNKADPNLGDKLGTSSPFTLAVWGGNVDHLNLLVKYGGDVNQVDANGESMLMLAVQCGNVEIAAALIEHGAIVNENATHNGWTPLMFATWQGDTKMVNLLIENEADVHKVSMSKETPLMLAAYKGHTEVMKVLLKENAELNAVSSKGHNALMFACSSGQTEAVNILLEHGVDIDHTDSNKETALFIAAANGHLAIVDTLCVKGASFIKNRIGFTPLMIATIKNYADVVLRLIESQSQVDEFCELHSIDQLNDDDSTKHNEQTLPLSLTSLHIAAYLGNYESALILVRSGANVSVKNSHGKTAFDMAKELKNVKIVDLLAPYEEVCLQKAEELSLEPVRVEHLDELMPLLRNAKKQSECHINSSMNKSRNMMPPFVPAVTQYFTVNIENVNQLATDKSCIVNLANNQDIDIGAVTQIAETMGQTFGSNRQTFVEANIMSVENYVDRGLLVSRESQESDSD